MVTAAQTRTWKFC